MLSLVRRSTDPPAVCLAVQTVVIGQRRSVVRSGWLSGYVASGRAIPAGSGYTVILPTRPSAGTLAGWSAAAAVANHSAVSSSASTARTRTAGSCANPIFDHPLFLPHEERDLTASRRVHILDALTMHRDRPPTTSRSSTDAPAGLSGATQTLKLPQFADRFGLIIVSK